MKVYEVYERTDESCGERKTFLRERDAQAYKKHLKGNWFIAEHEVFGKIPKYWRIDGGQYYNSRSHPDERIWTTLHVETSNQRSKNWINITYYRNSRYQRNFGVYAYLPFEEFGEDEIKEKGYELIKKIQEYVESCIKHHMTTNQIKEKIKSWDELKKWKFDEIEYTEETDD